MTAAALEALCATLLPGNGDWPGAAEAGVTGDLLRVAAADPAVAQALETVLAALPGDFAARDAAGRVKAVAAVEVSMGATFAAVLFEVYASYYAAAPTLQRLAAQGYPARPPQPGGRALPAFDLKPARATQKGPLP